MATFSPEHLTTVNYWAVLAASVLTFFLGALWYSPAVFENAWMNANGLDKAQVAQLQANLGAAGFASTFVAYLAMVLVLAVLLAVLGIHSIAGAIMLAALLWLGFVATTGLTVNLFSIRPLASWVIDAGFQLVGLIVAGAILGAWR